MLAIDSYHYYERVAIAVQNFKRDDFVFIASMDAAFQMTCSTTLQSEYLSGCSEQFSQSFILDI